MCSWPSRSVSFSLTAGRGLAFAAALVLPGSGLFALFHLATVEHRVCPEHGLLSHVEHHGDIQSAAQPDSFTRSRAPSSSHAHAHCIALVATSVGEVGPPRPPAQVAPSALTLGVDEAWLPPVIALLHVAPKASPPV